MLVDEHGRRDVPFWLELLTRARFGVCDGQGLWDQNGPTPRWQVAVQRVRQSQNRSFSSHPRLLPIADGSVTCGLQLNTILPGIGRVGPLCNSDLIVYEDVGFAAVHRAAPGTPFVTPDALFFFEEVDRSDKQDMAVVLGTVKCSDDQESLRIARSARPHPAILDELEVLDGRLEMQARIYDFDPRLDGRHPSRGCCVPGGSFWTSLKFPSAYQGEGYNMSVPLVYAHCIGRLVFRLVSLALLWDRNVLRLPFPVLRNPPAMHGIPFFLRDLAEGTCGNTKRGDQLCKGFLDPVRQGISYNLSMGSLQVTSNAIGFETAWLIALFSRAQISTVQPTVRHPHVDCFPNRRPPRGNPSTTRGYINATLLSDGQLAPATRDAPSPSQPYRGLGVKRPRGDGFGLPYGMGGGTGSGSDGSQWGGSQYGS